MPYVRVFEFSCVNLWNGPMILPDGTVMACNCVAAMDAVVEPGIGNILSEDPGQLRGRPSCQVRY